jgi:rootletin
LIAQNAQLRSQLEESHRTNESLTNDLQKLTNDWESLRDEMLSKEDEWKMEEEVKITYFIALFVVLSCFLCTNKTCSFRKV